MLLLYELYVEQPTIPDGLALRITDPKMLENTDRNLSSSERS